MKKVLVILLALSGFLGASAAKATPITTGSYLVTNFIQSGAFSGGDVVVSNVSTAGGTGTGLFNTGTMVGRFGLSSIFVGPTFTVQIGSDSCSANGAPNPTCGADLTFTFAPNLDPPGPELVVIDTPFTMTGLVTVGAVTRNIEGSGTLHAELTGLAQTSNVRFTFAAVPEPSSVLLMLVALIAMVGWSRRCRVLG